MAWHDHIIDKLKENDINTVAYIPDSVLSDLTTAIENDEYFTSVLVTREEEAVAILSGTWLGGEKGVLICQASGLANTFNALGSLNMCNRIPFLGIITERGDLGEHNLAQVPVNYPMPRLLDEIGVRNNSLDQEKTLKHKVEMAANTAFQTEEPYILFLNPLLTKGDSDD